MYDNCMGPHCPVDLRCRKDDYVQILDAKLDADRYWRGRRQDGFWRCPQCCVYWPVIQEPVDWIHLEIADVWLVREWWGYAHCEDCDAYWYQDHKQITTWKS